MNQTRQEAYETVLRGKMGSLSGKPSREYMLALRADLYEWIFQIEARLERQIREEAEHEALIQSGELSEALG